MYGKLAPACDANIAGPNITNFCGVGGVPYTYMLSQADETQGIWSPQGEGGPSGTTAYFPGQTTPDGLNSFETDSLLNFDGECIFKTCDVFDK